MEIKENPSFMAFNTQMKEEEGDGTVSLIVNFDKMKVTDDQIIAAKAIQARAAEELRKLLTT